jgi:hypothetical protein
MYQHGVLEPVQTFDFKVDEDGFLSVTFGKENGRDISIPDDTVDDHHGTLYLQKHAIVEGSAETVPRRKWVEQRRTITDTLFLREQSHSGTFLYAPHVGHRQHPKRHIHNEDYALETVTDVFRTKTYLFPGRPRSDSWDFSEQFAYGTEYSLGLTLRDSAV